MVRKYREPPINSICIGPQTSEWTRSKRISALPEVLTFGISDLCTFPAMHDSHRKSDIEAKFQFHLRPFFAPFQIFSLHKHGIDVGENYLGFWHKLTASWSSHHEVRFQQKWIRSIMRHVAHHSLEYFYLSKSCIYHRIKSTYPSGLIY